MPFDLTQPGTPIDAEKLKSISVMGDRSKQRAKPKEGKAHPDSGLPFVSRTDDNNATVTEHSVPGSGVSVRQDVTIRPTGMVLKPTMNLGSTAGSPANNKE